MCQGCLFALGGIRVLKCQAFYVQFKVDMIIDSLIKVDKKLKAYLLTFLKEIMLMAKLKKSVMVLTKRKTRRMTDQKVLLTLLIQTLIRTRNQLN